MLDLHSLWDTFAYVPSVGLVAPIDSHARPSDRCNALANIHEAADEKRAGFVPASSSIEG